MMKTPCFALIILLSPVLARADITDLRWYYGTSDPAPRGLYHCINCPVPCSVPVNNDNDQISPQCGQSFSGAIWVRIGSPDRQFNSDDRDDAIDAMGALVSDYQTESESIAAIASSEITNQLSNGDCLRAQATFARSRAQIVRKGGQLALRLFNVSGAASVQAARALRQDLIRQMVVAVREQYDEGGSLQGSAVNTLEAALYPSTGERIVSPAPMLENAALDFTESKVSHFERSIARNASDIAQQASRFIASGQNARAQDLINRADQLITTSSSRLQLRLAEYGAQQAATLQNMGPNGPTLAGNVSAAINDAIARTSAAEIDALAVIASIQP